MYRFFGLPENYKISLYRSIFQLCYYGKGGFTVSDVSMLPTQERMFYLKELNKARQEEQKQNERESRRIKSKSR